VPAAIEEGKARVRERGRRGHRVFDREHPVLAAPQHEHRDVRRRQTVKRRDRLTADGGRRAQRGQEGALRRRVLQPFEQALELLAVALGTVEAGVAGHLAQHTGDEVAGPARSGMEQGCNGVFR
jgi:hypothetical protein